MTSPATQPQLVCPPPNTELEVLALDARRRRDRIDATLTAMSARVERARENVEAYGAHVETLHGAARRYRWPLIGLAMLAGGLWGRRRRPQVLLLPAKTGAAEPRRATPGLLRSAVSAFASHFLRRAVQRALEPDPR